MSLRAGTVGRAHTLSLLGLEAVPILVEAVQLNGLPSFTIVGLPDAAVNEARERLRAGFHAISLPWPNRRLTVNLSPADVSKSGTGFDLAIAVAILGTMGYQLPTDAVVMGELGLDGSVRTIRGVLPALIAACEEGRTSAIVPEGNRGEAGLVAGVDVTAVQHLGQIAVRCGADCSFSFAAQGIAERIELPPPAAGDLADVYGQEQAIAALEVAAAGGHHMLMVGTPGIGKSMLARRLPGILPDLSPQAALEVAAISSLVGHQISELPTRAPLSAPHHSATTAAMVGGGTGIPRPGAITMAHRGVLFCDEFPEFSTRVIQSLRQPMEDGHIDLARAKASVRFPARFQLVAAANPCRCGNALDAPAKCTCTSRDHRVYRSSLGGPVRDRIDIQSVLRRPSKADLRRGSTATTAEVAARVSEARERQLRRLEGTGFTHNAEVSGRWLRENTRLSGSVHEMFETALAHGDLTLRGMDRIMRLGWSIADLHGDDSPTDDALALAFALRGGDGQ